MHGVESGRVGVCTKRNREKQQNVSNGMERRLGDARAVWL